MNNVEMLWKNLDRFLTEIAKNYDHADSMILEIGPSDVHKTAKDYFTKATVKTFDILPQLKPDYIGDLCKDNSPVIPDSSFDHVLCCEVLEHVVQPFDAVNEINRILKPKGLAFITTPFFLEIHPPFPDCWRFTEYGLKALFKGFDLVKIECIGNRAMPVQYTTIVRKR
jgi:SAM-dependent methyltransferase